MNSRRTKSVFAAVSALAVLALGATACASGDKASTASGSQNAAAANPGGGEKIKVVASTDVWGSVVTAVGGDKVEVTSIIHDPSADPHSYETTASDAIAAKNAKLTLSNGGGYDEFFSKLADQAAGAQKLVAVDIAATGNENEHVWYSLPGVEKIADQVAAKLGEIQPASKDAFTANATAFKGKTQELLKKVTGLGASGGKVVATEPVAHYLLDSAKVTDATPPAFAEAVEAEQDVPAAALNQVKQLISGKQVKALINNAQTTTPVTQQVVGDAKSAGIAVVDVTETLPQGVTDYIAWMTKSVDALAGALK
ncbi:metal ABC transporter solute-binding protein, Zn/Mn family [Amycolatopsis sp. BJA-103]|uniref:metal ABC transporter solute-binding protein, Zn/Mn family n=1 Tax=unclassified Amycolatopsis TaxID=2618356 RepID=UPI000C761A95|nr:zinc ABC transporter substrate-binding protein [Amycolatopsis sp. BJA-103]AUI62116.1 metal ABC transporter substrate-binding protein [Amycolatopsis sp. BJA-103]PNE20584.1 metal ABC transporter substrate-binding protein [Amycolatopsis sp. BJA-103]